MIGIVIAWLIVAFVLWDTISTIRWVREQRDKDKTPLMATIVITLALLTSEYLIYFTKGP